MKIEILTEEEVKLRFITPALLGASWDRDSQIRMEYYFTDGRIKVRGNKTRRGKKKFADYILLYKPNVPLAIIEAKDNSHNPGDGMQQALDYAQILDVPFVYSTNGEMFVEHDIKTGKEREIRNENFPTPQELWNRYADNEKFTEDQKELIKKPYHYEPGGKKPRYYQRIAINRTINAISGGQSRILLVMATGTGKTFTAFQIIYKLWKANKKRKILYLADRNILIDQTITEDFKPLSKVMTKIQGKKLDSAYQVYMSLYQQLAGDENEEPFRELTRDFFDLIVVDECHRGSAKEESRWRKILNYFNSATHIGMTATPKETKEVSNIDYFGKPLYTYSLKQGIDDGFLAPYKVIRIGLDVDLNGYRPEEGKHDVNGNLIEDREYNSTDFDRTLIIDDRTNAVAKRITEYLMKTDRFAKTIVFCIDIAHAERMRQALINENSDLVEKNRKYIMRITGDNPEGKAQLDNFIDVDSTYPTIVTTSELMTTGVNCKTCKLIVLDNTFGERGMTKFKQIIGRGTRIREDYDKMFFTIMDFRNASRLFADPDFDGDPVQIYNPGEGDSIVPPEDDDEKPDTENGEGGSETDGYNPDDYTPPEFISPPIKEKPTIYRVNDVPVKILSDRVQYLNSKGKLITESLTDYSRKNILNQYANLDSFLSAWNSKDKKEAIIEELKQHGIFLDELKEKAENKELDEFDLVCHIAFDKKPLTKAERANNVKKRGYLYKYSEKAQEVLNTLLEKYSDFGITEIEDIRILEQKEFTKFGGPTKVVKIFGGKSKYIKAVRELEKEIYAA